MTQNEMRAMRGMPWCVRLSEGLGITALWLDSVRTHGGLHLRLLGSLGCVQAIAWREDGLNFGGANNDDTVYGKPVSCHGLERPSPVQVVGVLSPDNPSRAKNLEALLNKDINEADAHVRVRLDVSHTPG